MKRRLTPARRARTETPGGSPAATMASRVASTRAALASESARRRRARRSPGSAMASIAFGDAVDGREQRRASLEGETTELGWEGGIEGGAAFADGGDGGFDALAILSAEPGEHLLVGEHEPAHHLDLLARGHSIGPGPLRQLRD